MDKGYRFLERVELGERKDSFERVISHKCLIESIHNHLRDLLNTHAGNAMIANDYGLPDFNDVLAENANLLREIRENIKDAIEQYEPRLKDVSVKSLSRPDDPLQLCFAVSGQVNHNGKDLPLSIDVSVGIDGRFDV